jgi:hypothetical protein
LDRYPLHRRLIRNAPKLPSSSGHRAVACVGKLFLHARKSRRVVVAESPTAISGTSSSTTDPTCPVSTGGRCLPPPMATPVTCGPARTFGAPAPPSRPSPAVHEIQRAQGRRRAGRARRLPLRLSRRAGLGLGAWPACARRRPVAVWAGRDSDAARERRASRRWSFRGRGRVSVAGKTTRGKGGSRRGEQRKGRWHGVAISANLADGGVVLDNVSVDFAGNIASLIGGFVCQRRGVWLRDACLLAHCGRRPIRFRTCTCHAPAPAPMWDRVRVPLRLASELIN